MILFYDIVEILDLADGDGGTVLLVVALDRRLIGRTPIDGDLLCTPWRRMALVRNSLAACSSRCAVRRKSMVWPVLSTGDRGNTTAL